MAAPPGGTVSQVDADEPAPEGAALAPGDRVEGIYRVERLLGEGGAGAVFLVRHEGLGDARFALKVLHAGAARSELLTREGRLAAQIRSAHVVKVAAMGSLPGGAPYLVMEYVDGPTLEELAATRALGLDEAIACGHQLGLALEAAHDQELIHGDVSLRNVFATRQADGSLHLQLGDFGLVRRVRRDASATVSVEVGAARGTPRFMAPEVLSGVDAVDHRSDLFAVGVVLYRLLAGVFPFDGATGREIFAAILRGQPVPLVERRPELAAVSAVVMRCLASDPAHRFASARALRDALEAARTAVPAPIAAAPTAVGPPARPARRGRVGGAAGAAAFVAAAAAAIVWVVGDRRARDTFPAATALDCPDTTGAALAGEPALGHAVAQAVCARVAARLDVDWGGGPGAAVVRTRLDGEPGRGFVLTSDVGGRAVVVRGATPLAAAEEAARVLGARFTERPMSAAEVHRWGARDAASARAARTVWRQRTTIQLEDYEQAPRAVLARDPTSPFMHLLLAEMDQEPTRRREARAQALAQADRLPAARAAALRGSLAVQDDPDAPDAGLVLLRGAYSSSPDDLEIAVLYTRALVTARHADSALGLIDEIYARFPRRALLAVHHGQSLPARGPDDLGYLIERVVATRPEARAWSGNVSRLTDLGRLDEARAALAFGAQLGVSAGELLLPTAVLALAAGDPAAVPLRQLGDTRQWAHNVGARMRLAVLLLTGQAAAAATFIGAQLAVARAADDRALARYWAGEGLKLARRTGGGAAAPADLDAVAADLPRARLPLATHAALATELILARARAGAPIDDTRAALADLDRALAERAGSDALLLLGARLRTLPLVRLALGDGEAARRWHLAGSAWHLERVLAALDAAPALAATGDLAAAEAAYRLAASPYDIERHPLEAVAARLGLVDLLAARGRAAEGAADLAFVDRVLAAADPGLRERLRGR